MGATALFFRLFDGPRHFLRRHAPREHRNGRRAEDLAMRHLQKLGFTVVARNYRPRAGHGEIDIVAWQASTLVFVEVKSAESARDGTPDRAIDEQKRQTLERAARGYATRAKVSWDHVRFDVVTVIGLQRPLIQHFPAAW